MRADRGGHEAAVVAPGEEPGAGPGVSAAGVGIADIGREELDIAPGGFVAEIGDQRRHDIQRTLVGGGLRRRDGRRHPVLRFLRLVEIGPPVQASPRFTRSGVIGRWRSRLPVSAATALAIAGATNGTPASPMPVGRASVEITVTAIGGTSDIRMTGYS